MHRINNLSLRLLLFFTMFMGGQLMAQQTITGTVTDSQSGETLIGVNIYVQGSTDRATITDLNGNFSIEASAGEVLIISYTGMSTQTITLGESSLLDIVMSSNLVLDEVVITTGYGNQLRSTYTGSAAKAPMEEIALAPRSNFQEGLAGNITGVQVNQGSGQPGAFQNVTIRGLGSISAGSNPLYVIDGIPVINENIGNESTTSTPLSGINPQDIEDITVLKDASATAIYGSRGANGVIIITTKKGKAGKAKISFNIQTGVSDVSLSDKIKPLNSAEYTELMREGLINAGLAGDQSEATQYLLDRGVDPAVDSDWFNEITRTGNFTNANLSVSGGTEEVRYFMSGGYQKNQATVVGSSFERASGRLNLSTKVNDWLDINLNNSISFTKQNTVPDGGFFANPVRALFRFIPTQAIFNEDGSYNLNINAGFHPIGNIVENKDQSNILNLLSTLSATVDLPFSDGLTYEPYVSINRVQGTDETFFIPDFGSGASNNGLAEADFDNNTNWLLRNMVKYSNYFNDAHGIDITLGHEAQKFSSHFVETQAANFGFPSLITLSNAAEPLFIGGTKTENSIESFFLNTSYNYQGKYYVNATVGRDGSSRFGSGVRHGTFWSSGGAVNLHRMAFLENHSMISDLRVRASYGENGNENIGNFPSRGLYATGADYLDNPGIFLNQLENSNLTWEVNKQFDVGVELGLWNRVNLIFDFYNRKTSSLLFDLPVSLTNGVSSVTKNIGELQNRGIEVELNTENIVTQDGFRWSTGLNFTVNRNKVLSLPEGDFADGSRFRAVGTPWNTWYIPGYAGVNPDNGAPQWYTNEDETELTSTYADADPYTQGTSNPDIFGGLRNTISYKGFTVNANMNFSWGGKILHAWHSFTHTDGSRGLSTTGNLARSIYDRRWQNPGDITDTPIFIFGQNQGSRNRSTRFLYDGSFISLRDITVSYQFPTSVLESASISNASVFLRGSNLWIYAKDDRLERDPRVDASGFIDQEIPVAQTFTFGLDLNF